MSLKIYTLEAIKLKEKNIITASLIISVLILCAAKKGTKIKKFLSHWCGLKLIKYVDIVFIFIASLNYL